ncbi:UNKNOWN [Stylonychia lemnae]|uniref:Uncharacterized protein n=1 Tax=Stylonychia lemnae TaxID=5949 RepID=A0A078AQ41_STYLE|nr:UNKNOWN [Stylonychia lemnae]|eukprot:CDW84495.1 UNKNOWN [Stylonychia lemnae]
MSNECTFDLEDYEMEFRNEDDGEDTASLIKPEVKQKTDAKLKQTSQGGQKKKGSEEDQHSLVDWMLKLFRTFDQSYLQVMTVSYFIQGFKIFIDLSVMDLFKQYLKIEPAESQILTSIIYLPWSLKVVYGLIADNIPVFGSKRRSYIAMNGFLEFIFLLPLVSNLANDKYTITICLTLYAINVAFNDSIIDALMVMQARRDPIHGSEDLNSYTWIWLAIGGMVGSLSAGYLTEYLDPHRSFLLCGLLGLLISFLGLRLNKEIDQDPLSSKKFSKKEFRKNMKSIKKALQSPQVFNTLVYIMLTGVLVPKYNDVSYYFQLTALNFSKMTYSMLTFVSYVSMLLGTMIYNRYFQEWEFRNLFQLCQLGFLFCSLCKLTLIMRLNLGIIDDLAFVFFTNIIQDTMNLALNFLPSVVLFTKITPFNIEATLFATLSGIQSFAQNVGGPLFGSILCKYFGVTNENFDKYHVLVMIQIGAIILSFLFIWFVPTKKEIQKAQDDQLKEHEKEIKTINYI